METTTVTTPVILSGNIESLLGLKGKDLATMSDDELRLHFKDVFDFEKSLRDNAGLIKAETPSTKDPDADENHVATVAAKKPTMSAKEKNQAKRLAMIKELVDLQRDLGMKASNSPTPTPTTKP